MYVFFFISRQNLGGPNDNVFVNSIEVGGRFLALTDAPITLDFDPLSLGMNGRVAWTDTLDKGFIPMSSAHPQRSHADPVCR